MAAATGFYSTAEDLCRYSAAHFFGNNELLSDRSKQSCNIRFGRYKVEKGTTRSSSRSSTSECDGLSVTAAGTRGYGALSLFDPRDRFAVAVLANAIDGRGRTRRSR